MVGIWTDEAEAGTYGLGYYIFNPNYGRIFYKPADAEFLALRITVQLRGGASYRTTRVIADGVEVGVLTVPVFKSNTESFTSNTIVIPAGTKQVEIQPYPGGDIIDMPNYGQWGTASAEIWYSRASGMSEFNEIKNSINTISTKLDNVDTKVVSTQTTANNVLTQINNLNTKIESLQTPVIYKVSTQNGATASTTGQSPPIIVNASGADKFGLSLDGTDWLDGFDINTGGSISGLSSGVNNIRVRAYDSSVPAEKRKYAYGNILIFGL